MKIKVPQTRKKMRDSQNCGIAMVLWLFLLLLAAQASSVFVCEDYSDCQTLLEFKKGINSDPDGHLRDWNEANPFCNWTGVTCHRNLQNRVMSLQLDDKRLQGSLSPFLSNLSRLATLSLRNNTFYSQIPSSFGELSEVTYLDLSENNLEGQIPASLQGCQSLKFLDFTGNKLSGVIPEQLGVIKSLTDLCLSGNNLTGSIPSSLSNLTELRRLELGDNYFTGKIPPQFGELIKLEILYFHINYLEGSIPSAISNCTALREISWSKNLLSGSIPVDIGSKMQSLQKMYLSLNRLSGKIPAILSNLSQLILFDVSLNKLVGEVPMEFGMLKNLENLYLHSNDLVSGGDNTSLRFLTSLTNCTRLKKLHLGSCLFSGKLPDSIGGLSKELFYFNLLDNRITGNIPEGIGNLSSLVNLEWHYNLLSGKIPESFGKLKQLQRLSLGRNRLIGEIPGEIGQMANLGYLDLSRNSISGKIPLSICNSGQLRYLYLSHNRLWGKIPVELTQCSLLLLLDLSYNQFQDSVPTEIGLLSSLALSLNLSNNNFEGRVPENIGKLTSLEAVDFSSNNFSGLMPSSIGSCIALEYLNFSNNRIEGPIPESLKQIKYLESLDLSHNQLNGTIPVWIGKNLIKFLNLSYNRLSGEVPENGSFRNFSRSSFLGNLGLCGGSLQTGLPPCKVQHGKQKLKNKILYSILAFICSMLFMLTAFAICYLFYKKREKKQDSTAITVTSSSSMHWTRTYTERELEIATDGFSEENLLGRGSFGSVYKAVIGNGGNIVAVKVFNKESAQSFKSLKRECEILSNIRHRNLLRILGISWNFQFKALVLEFIPNGNLEHHLYPGGCDEDPCKLSLEERMSIAIDIANGLQYLQEDCPTQIVHCDLKPQNVLIDYDLVAHIADFGIGKVLLDKPNEHNSTTGFLRGSIGYIPPEYGQGLEVSAKGDIYSFGVLLLEMITRKRPTSDMFSDGLDLRRWVVSCFPSNVMDVVDTTLKHRGSYRDIAGRIERIEQCCTRVLNIALMCTAKNPYERPPMSSVVQTLLSIAEDVRLENPDDIEVPEEQNKAKEEEKSILHEFR